MCLIFTCDCHIVVDLSTERCAKTSGVSCRRDKLHKTQKCDVKCPNCEELKVREAGLVDHRRLKTYPKTGCDTADAAADDERLLSKDMRRPVEPSGVIAGERHDENAQGGVTTDELTMELQSLELQYCKHRQIANKEDQKYRDNSDKVKEKLVCIKEEILKISELNEGGSVYDRTLMILREAHDRTQRKLGELHQQHTTRMSFITKATEETDRRISIITKGLQGLIKIGKNPRLLFHISLFFTLLNKYVFEIKHRESHLCGFFSPFR